MTWFALRPLLSAMTPARFDVVHGQVEVQERSGFGEELGEGNGACRGHLGRGEKEAFEGGVECKCRTQRLNL